MRGPLQLSAQGGVGSVTELNLIINKDKVDSEYCASVRAFLCFVYLYAFILFFITRTYLKVE